MKNIFKILSSISAIGLFVGVFSYGATLIFPYQGGIGKDSSGWTGCAQINAGVWSTTTCGGLVIDTWDILGTTMTATDTIRQLTVSLASTSLATTTITTTIKLRENNATADYVYLTNNSNWTNATTVEDGFKMRWLNTGIGLGANNDTLIFDKTDGNDLDPDGAIQFVMTGSDGTSTPALTILGNGSIGIGTTTPIYTIDVDGRLRVSATSTLATSTITDLTLTTLHYASSTNWDLGYAQRLQWDGGSTNLTAATGRTSLGLGDAALLSSTTWCKVANNLSDLANATTARANLGLVIGTNVQAQSGYLQTISAMSPTAGSLLIGSAIDGDFHQVEAFSDSTGYLKYNYGGTNTSTALALGYLWMGNGDGTLSQISSTTLAGAGTTPGGLSGQIQYNNNGSFGGMASTTYNTTTYALVLATTTIQTLSLTNALTLSNTDFVAGDYLSTSTAGQVDVSNNLAKRKTVFNFVPATTTAKNALLSSAVPVASTLLEAGCWTDAVDATATVDFFESVPTAPEASSSSILIKLVADYDSATTSSFLDSAIATNNIINAKITGINNASTTRCYVKYLIDD